MSDARGGALAIVADDVVKSFSTAAGGLVHRDLYTSKEWIKAANFYSSIFQDLISHGYLSPESKSLCVESPERQDVFALKEIGVLYSVGIFKKASKPLVISHNC